MLKHPAEVRPQPPDDVRSKKYAADVLEIPGARRRRHDDGEHPQRRSDRNLFWRPVTAIRLADTDGNPLTIGDPTWTPLQLTYPIPDYDSGHAV